MVLVLIKHKVNKYIYSPTKVKHHLTCFNNIFSNNELISNRFTVFVTCTHILIYMWNRLLIDLYLCVYDRVCKVPRVHWSRDYSNRPWPRRNVNCGRFMGRRARIPWWWRRLITVRVLMWPPNEKLPRTRVWRQRNTSFQDNHILGTTAFGDGGVTVWGCFSFDFNLTGQKYRSLLL
jgi:hypothetical protein